MSSAPAPGPPLEPGDPARATIAASFFRRQLVLAAVAGAVVLAAVAAVGMVMDQGRGAAHAALRPAADGSGVRAVSPLAESSRSAVWAVGLALIAVAAVLTVLVDHVLRVARFAVLARPDRHTHRDPAPGAAMEDH